MRKFAYFSCLPLLLIFFTTGCVTSNSSRQVALVMGNSAYQYTTALPNPSNDARQISYALRENGFEVIEVIDSNYSEFSKKLNRFSTLLKGAKVGLFYYAGHGIQISGKNFLVPIDARFDESLFASKESLERSTVNFDKVLKVLSSPSRVSLVFLDACRNNPLVEDIGDNKKGRSVSIRNRQEKSVTTAILRKGLAQIEAKSSMNMFIAYATQPGNVALDGKGENSPFTTALLKHIEIPGLEVRELLTLTRKTVMEETDNTQIPWDHASLTESFFFKETESSSHLPP